jgi:hypothetical protein
MKFPVAPKSTGAVETIHEKQPASEMKKTGKGLAESDDDDGILTPTPGDGG